jgi:DNA-binding NarL/FixJ family response regulator
MIARELHDIVAHSLSVMIVQAEGGRAAATRKPEVAAEALDTIAETGREALHEMRRIVGVLRAGPNEEPASYAPAPTLEEIPDMVARTSDRITLVVQGNPQPVSQALALTAYRVTQEALTNFLKHAGLRGDGRRDAHLLGALHHRRRGGQWARRGRPHRRRRERPARHVRAGLLHGRLAGRRTARRRSGLPCPRGDPHRGRRPQRRQRGNTTMSSDTIRVFLADDQALVRSGFRMLIDSEDDLEVTGEAPNGADTVAALLTSPADVVLMDIRMPVMDGVEATRRIVEAGIETHVLVLTTFDLDEYAFAALKAGASGFMLKDARPTDLLNAIRNVAAGDAVVAPSTTRRLLDHVVPTLSPTPGEHDPRLALLTEREREVLLEVAGGSTNAEIAKTLYMAEGTVKTHIGRLLTKLQARDRVGLVLFAYENGLAGH